MHWISKMPDLRGACIPKQGIQFGDPRQKITKPPICMLYRNLPCRSLQDKDKDENPDKIDLIESSLKANKEKIQMAYMGAAKFVDALPDWLVGNLVRVVQKEGREAARYDANIMAALAAPHLDDGTDKAEATERLSGQMLDELAGIAGEGTVHDRRVALWMNNPARMDAYLAAALPLQDDADSKLKELTRADWMGKRERTKAVGAAIYSGTPVTFMFMRRMLPDEDLDALAKHRSNNDAELFNAEGKKIYSDACRWFDTDGGIDGMVQEDVFLADLRGAAFEWHVKKALERSGLAFDYELCVDCHRIGGDAESDAVDALVGRYLERHYPSLNINGVLFVYDPNVGTYGLDADMAHVKRIMLVLYGAIFPSSAGHRHVEERAKTLLGQKAPEAEGSTRTPYIALLNCLLDTQNGTTCDFTPAKRAYNRLNISYDENAECPGTERIIREITTCDEEKASRIYDMLALLMMPDKFECESNIFMLVGPGNNGKSTIANMAMAALGGDNYASTSLFYLATASYVSDTIRGKIAVISTESGSSEPVRSADRLRQISSGEPMTVQDKWRKAEKMAVQCTQMHSANTVPNIHDQSLGWFRRLCYVELTEDFRGDKRDQDRISTVLASESERSGLLNLLIPRMREIRGRHDIEMPQDPEDVKRWYNSRVNSAHKFHDTCLEVKPGCNTRKALVYYVYRWWCGANAEDQWGLHAFNRYLGELLTDDRTKTSETEGTNERFWHVSFKEGVQESYEEAQKGDPGKA